MVSDGSKFLYVVGGGNDTHNVNTVERYNSQSKTWKYLTTIPIALQYHNCVYMNGTIIVTGGMNGGVIVNTIYLYTVATDTWTKSTTVLQEPVFQHAMGQSITH